MEIEFVKAQKNPNQYFIIKHNELYLLAEYNKKEDKKELFTPNHTKVGHGFSYASKRFQLVPDYFVQIFDKENFEVLVQHKSLLRQTYSFTFEGCSYSIISHVGCKFSIFKTEKQVAYYQTGGDNLGSGNMLLVADDNICEKLFCLIALHLHSAFGSESRGTNATFNLVFQKSRFNKYWRPS